MTLDDYIHLFGCDVVRWAHVRARVNTSLFDMLQQLQQYDVQILYTNTELVTTPRTFDALCELVSKGTVWGLNIGEAELDAQQCQSLYTCVAHSNVAFMFIDAVFVGNSEVKRFKTLIQQRRRQTRGRWTMGVTTDQDAIIMRCRNMWFAPWSLGRNKNFLARGHG
tara:strand:- start:312 stop:809 length:498 start_codon:yes stop_codon:yes gene_type:complete